MISAMVVSSESVHIPAGPKPMSMFVAMPQASGTYPGILCYSDIFQLTGPMLRACTRLAGYGFVIAAPEIYHRVEPAGAAIPFDDAGRTRGLENARRTPVAHFDEDRRAALQYLAAHPKVAEGKLGAMGFCIGGHLAFRAAFESTVLATACFYGTGIHDGSLGLDDDAGSLGRAAEIRGKLLMIWGAQDPHVPTEGRAEIDNKLREAQVDYAFKLYPAEHAFTRDEGPRYDPEATDQAFGDMIALFRNAFRNVLAR
jgi:carboxymethylenebutenolidase